MHQKKMLRSAQLKYMRLKGMEFSIEREVDKLNKIEVLHRTGINLMMIFMKLSQNLVEV